MLGDVPFLDNLPNESAYRVTIQFRVFNEWNMSAWSVLYIGVSLVIAIMFFFHFGIKCARHTHNYICLNEKQNSVNAFSESNNLLQGFSLFSPTEMCVIRCFLSLLRLHHTTGCRCRRRHRHRRCRLHPHNIYWYYSSVQRSLNVFAVNMSH